MSGPALVPAPVPAPARVRARVRHRRLVPFGYDFAHGTTMWLVDVAAPNAAFPRWLRPFASIRSTDHLAPGDRRPLPDKVRAFLTANGVPWRAHRVLMLANARSFGYVFDPLTTYFCFDEDDRLEGVLAEVHNTYGERHCYPLAVGEGASARVDKEFYVSPFLTVAGRYDISVRLDPGRVAVAVGLSQEGRTVFTASVRGALEPATRRRALRAVAADPFPSQRVSALIRLHGVRLWLRRLPVVPRRPHQAPKGMA